MAAQTSVEFSPPGDNCALPVFPELAVDDWRILSDRPGHVPGVGKIITSLVTMTDQTAYINRDIYPKKRTNECEIEIETALGTRVAGANTLWGEMAAVATGSVVSIFGSNQNCAVPTSHSQDVWSASLVNTTEVPARGHKSGEGPRILWGKSMGGMANNGKLAYAPLFNTEIAYALNEDPSLVHATGIAETVRGITLLDIAQEGIEFGADVVFRQEGESHARHLKRLFGMRETFGVSPSYAKTHWNAGKGIWRGDAGRFLPHIPADQAMTTIMLNLNRLNHRAEYGQHQENMPNAYIVDRNYKHLALGRHFMVMAGIDALQTATNMLSSGKTPTEVAKHVSSLLELRLPHREKP
ncbi:hypothetical protein H7097_00985 [Aeromicrobium sp.]|nr:hypothetical protein [Candidatus Saccharibacteria bacterium]